MQTEKIGRKYTAVRDKNGKTVRENDIILVKFNMDFSDGEKEIQRYVKIDWDGRNERFVINLPNGFAIVFSESFPGIFDIEIVGNALKKSDCTFKLLDKVHHPPHLF